MKENFEILEEDFFKNRKVWSSGFWIFYWFYPFTELRIFFGQLPYPLYCFPFSPSFTPFYCNKTAHDFFATMKNRVFTIDKLFFWKNPLIFKRRCGFKVFPCGRETIFKFPMTIGFEFIVMFVALARPLLFTQRNNQVRNFVESFQSFQSFRNISESFTKWIIGLESFINFRMHTLRANIWWMTKRGLRKSNEGPNKCWVGVWVEMSQNPICEGAVQEKGGSVGVRNE